MRRGTKVGDALAALAGACTVLAVTGHWQGAVPLLALLFAYACLRIRFLRLP